MALQLLKVALSALISILVLFLLTRFMGASQISQLSLFDYINGITLGSIAAELALSGLTEMTLDALVAVVVYSLCTIAVSVLCNKSIKARRFLVGKPTVLYDNDTLFEENLMKAKLDVNEFLTAARVAGYFDLSDVESAVLETNGNISFLPKSTARPLTPEDVQLKPQQDKMVYNVVIDGKIMPNCLRESGNNEAWLTAALQQQGVKLEALILATCDDNNKLTVYEKTGDAQPRSIFL